jgi:predicted XRE-type DNA-binding protein
MPSRPWREIRAKHSKVTPERQAEIDAEVRREIARMRLRDLRQARQLSQVQIAETLGMRQGDVSRLERQTDMYLSTLARFVTASGGRLRLVAEYDDAEPIELDVLGGLSDIGRTA